MPLPNSFNQSVIEEFRTNGGKVGGPFEGGDLLLLTTTGARSGKEHTTPLAFLRDGDLLFVVASAGGAPRHPAWYHNLLAHPMVRVELGTGTFPAIAVPAEGARRDELFELAVRRAPGFRDYQSGTSRTLPVVVLERTGTDEGEEPREIRTLADQLLAAHIWLRGQLRHVRAETDSYFTALAAHRGPGAPPAPGLGLQIRQHCLAFCQALETHHAGEDVHLFPALAERHPDLRPVLDRLGAEHRTVARLQGELAALLADLATADPRRFRAELSRLSEELTAHLDHEEATILPALAAIPFPPAREAPGSGGAA